jgi:hypothetical protein
MGRGPPRTYTPDGRLNPTQPCWGCGEYHWRTDCPVSPKCHICHGEHMGKNCPTHTSSRGRDRPQNPSDTRPTYPRAPELVGSSRPEQVSINPQGKGKGQGKGSENMTKGGAPYHPPSYPFRSSSVPRTQGKGEGNVKGGKGYNSN